MKKLTLLIMVLLLSNTIKPLDLKKIDGTKKVIVSMIPLTLGTIAYFYKTEKAVNQKEKNIATAIFIVSFLGTVSFQDYLFNI